MNEMMAPEMDNRLIYVFLKLYTVVLYPQVYIIFATKTLHVEECPVTCILLV